MKVMKWLVLMSLVAGFSQWPLFPKISSRVQGKVIDKDTKQPIQGAKVQLIYLTSGTTQRLREQDQETLTDQNGKFKFDVRYYLTGTDFYLQCEKKGYISLIPDYYFGYFIKEKFQEMTGVFTLQEGQVKHFAIELGKGGGLKGTIYKKEASGISPFSDLSGNLERRNNPDATLLKDYKHGYNIAPIYTDENGKFEIEGIEPYDDYSLVFFPGKRVLEVIQPVKIVKNINENIEYIIDLTDQTGIEGVIKIGQDFAQHGFVVMIKNETAITSLTQNDMCSDQIYDQGCYSCKGLNPGRYLLKVNVESKDGVSRIEEFVVDIISGTTKVFNINL